MPDISCRYASENEAETLSALAFRSKAHWGYSEEFMEACRRELSCSGDDIAAEDSVYAVAEVEGRIAGYVALVKLDGDSVEIDGLFVDPDCIGLGVGKMLMTEAIDESRALGVSRILIQADPNASEFYAGIGAKACGERESASIPGRMLPMYQIDV